MALTQVYSAVPNDVITAARWNNEFGNIYNNGTTLAFPVTTAVSFAGFTVTFDSNGQSTLTSSSTTGFIVTAGTKNGTPGTAGSQVNVIGQTFTDSNTAGSGTAALATFNSFQQPTLAASNATVACTDAANVYIANSPANGTNETIANPWALWADNGNVRLDGELVAAVNPYRFTATVAANALTITLQTVNGATSAGIPVAFRSATLATPQLATVSSSAATTLVISSGSTLGTISAVPSRIWVGVLNNAGTVELFAYNSLKMVALGAFPQALAGPSVIGLQESNLITTTAEGGAGGATSSQKPYSTSARTSVPFRWLGYIESTQATAGTWVTAPSKVQMMQPGVLLPGACVQRVMNFDSTTATGTTALPFDNTTPLITEGDQYLSQVITPTFAGNLLIVSGAITLSHSANATISYALNDGTNTVSAGIAQTSVANLPSTNPINYNAIANTTNATTWAVRAGGGTGSTTAFNGVSGGIRLNVLHSHLCIEEIAV